jgi:hypothetical protein
VLDEAHARRGHVPSQLDKHLSTDLLDHREVGQHLRVKDDPR